MNKLLTRFWFKFESPPMGFGLGCGVTAYSYDDALALLREAWFTRGEMPKVASYLENVDVSTLDANHILPNIGVTSFRGVWFPNLSLR